MKGRLHCHFQPPKEYPPKNRKLISLQENCRGLDRIHPKRNMTARYGTNLWPQMLIGSLERRVNFVETRCRKLEGGGGRKRSKITKGSSRDFLCSLKKNQSLGIIAHLVEDCAHVVHCFNWRNVIFALVKEWIHNVNAANGIRRVEYHEQNQKYISPFRIFWEPAHSLLLRDRQQQCCWARQHDLCYFFLVQKKGNEFFLLSNDW